MPQKTIIVGMLCLTMLLTVWVLHASPCEFAAGTTVPAIRLPKVRSKVAPLHTNHKEKTKVRSVKTVGFFIRIPKVW